MMQRFAVLGSGAVTPLGRDLADMARALEARARPAEEWVEFAGREFPCHLVPGGFVRVEEKLPRLRRSSAISHFAVAAAKDAVAGLTPDELREMPVLFATTDGGVRYTRRFNSEIQRSGAGAGSPLLFPETVYNAPASHIAAVLGSEREATAFVGDAAASMSALATAGLLLTTGEAQHVLVVGAQECDPIAVAGYGAWGVVKDGFSARVAPLASEGAAALLLGRAPGAFCGEAAEGLPFRTRSQAAAGLRSLLGSLPRCEEPLVFSSAWGTRLAEAEETAVGLPGARRLSVCEVFGEAFACSVLLQWVLAAQVLRAGQSALITCLGASGGVGAGVLTRGGARGAS